MKRTRRKQSVRKQLSVRKKLLRKDTLTKTEYNKIRKLFKRQTFDIKKGEFAVDVYRKINVKGKGSRTIPINEDEFIKSKKYEVYIRHKATRQRRLLALGKLQDIPIFTKQPERFGNVLAGRTFDPKLKYPKRKHGKWVPVNKIVRDIQKELEEIGKDIQTEIRASIIPLKRYFHSKWKIYSDEIVSGNKQYRAIFVHCAVRFVYPNQDWIGKQSILLDFQDEKVRLSQLHKMIPKLEDDLNFRLELLHPQAENVSVIEVNGFIPLY